jgi:hypothetical protein
MLSQVARAGSPRYDGRVTTDPSPSHGTQALEPKSLSPQLLSVTCARMTPSLAGACCMHAGHTASSPVSSLRCLLARARSRNTEWSSVELSPIQRTCWKSSP